jgi:hypothetical protein
VKLFDWVQFEWDLAALPNGEVCLPNHYQIVRATPDDEPGLRKLFSSAFLLDPSWNPAITQTMQTVQPWLDDAFGSETKLCLALRHGARIIGASVISTNTAADNHLMPGPCVLIEYRNRAFGTALLQSSLKLLAQSGLTKAVAITRPNAPVAKFLYPKFGGVAVATDSRPLLAA